jgi:hypothetical protein
MMIVIFGKTAPSAAHRKQLTRERIVDVASRAMRRGGWMPDK